MQQPWGRVVDDFSGYYLLDVVHQEPAHLRTCRKGPFVCLYMCFFALFFFSFFFFSFSVFFFLCVFVFPFFIIPSPCLFCLLYFSLCAWTDRLSLLLSSICLCLSRSLTLVVIIFSFPTVYILVRPSYSTLSPVTLSFSSSLYSKYFLTSDAFGKMPLAPLSSPTFSKLAASFRVVPALGNPRDNFISLESVQFPAKFARHVVEVVPPSSTDGAVSNVTVLQMLHSDSSVSFAEDASFRVQQGFVPHAGGGDWTDWLRLIAAGPGKFEMDLLTRAERCGVHVLCIICDA